MPLPVATKSDSPWTPLAFPLFRGLWIASVFSHIGTWMQNVGGVWLMTSLTPSPFLAAAMHGAQSLPFFLIGLPAGAIADVFDRRKVLLFTQVIMALAAGSLGVLSLVGWITPGSLLALTFGLGVGAALNAPAWQAAMPEVAGREELPKAVALNGIGFNIARVVGPGLGGVIVAVAGASASFFANALSFVGVFFAVLRWDRRVAPPTLPSEHLLGAMRAGLRYVRHAPLLQTVLFRSAAFIFFASALWALLPVVARQELGLGSAGYGLLVGCLGVGSLGAAVLLPRATRLVSLDARLVGAGVLFAVATLALAAFENVPLLCLMMVVAGVGWLTTMVGVNVATQSVVPDWVQARAMALYVLITQGGQALGSFLWGAVASHWGVRPSLAFAGVGMLAGLAAVYRWPLAKVKEVDTAPAGDLVEVPTNRPFDPDDGPVLVTVEYRIDPQRTSDFKRALRDLRAVRRRDGAIRWELYHDVEVPGRFLETFVVESWAEHLRQHARLLRADLPIRKQVRSFQLGGEPPRVTHSIYEELE